MDAEKNNLIKEIAIVKAGENGVTISTVAHEGMENEPPIRLDEGEIFLMIINKSVRGYKIRGKVEIQTSLGEVKGHSKLIVESGQVDQ